MKTTLTLQQANDAILSINLQSRISDNCVEFGRDGNWINHFSQAELIISNADSLEHAIAKFLSKVKKDASTWRNNNVEALKWLA